MSKINKKTNKNKKNRMKKKWKKAEKGRKREKYKKRKKWKKRWWKNSESISIFAQWISDRCRAWVDALWDCESFTLSVNLYTRAHRYWPVCRTRKCTWNGCAAFKTTSWPRCRRRAWKSGRIIVATSTSSGERDGVLWLVSVVPGEVVSLNPGRE